MRSNNYIEQDKVRRDDAYLYDGACACACACKKTCTLYHTMFFNCNKDTYMMAHFHVRVHVYVRVHGHVHVHVRVRARVRVWVHAHLATPYCKHLDSARRRIHAS